MSRIPYLIAGMIAALAVAAPGSAGMSATKLTGTVGPGFTISLKKGTAKVKTLKKGKYTITVKDKSNIHDFRLKGPGLNKRITSVAFVGTKTVTVTLKKGKYIYVCDPHAASMTGRFTVK
jgi:Copper binding proteins, plastocyanin/azurin family